MRPCVEPCRGKPQRLITLVTLLCISVLAAGCVSHRAIDSDVAPIAASSDSSAELMTTARSRVEPLQSTAPAIVVATEPSARPRQMAAAAQTPPRLVLPLRDVPRLDLELLNQCRAVIAVDPAVVAESVHGPYQFDVTLFPAREASRELLLIGNADDLAHLAREASFVQGRGLLPRTWSYVVAYSSGPYEAIKSMFVGIWQLVRHPIDSISALAGGAKQLAKWAWDTPVKEMQAQVWNMCVAVYVDYCCEVAAANGLNYFALQTAEARGEIQSEATLRAGSRAITELALLVVPFSKLSGVGTAAKVGGRAALGGELALAAEGKVAQGARVGEALAPLFPKVAAQQRVAIAAEEVAAASKARMATVRVARVGKAVRRDYAKTFFEAHPELKGSVHIHHAVPQSVLDWYPEIFDDLEIHSLENLRGIPSEIAGELNQSKLNKEWNAFRRRFPDGGPMPTRAEVLKMATEMDKKYGHLFNPPLR
jgi:hypothetical protein